MKTSFKALVKFAALGVSNKMFDFNHACILLSEKTSHRSLQLCCTVVYICIFYFISRN